MREGFVSVWNILDMQGPCRVEGKSKEIKKKKVGARVWKKWQGKRGKKEIKKKNEGMCVEEKKRGKKKKKKIWIKK